MGIMLWETLAEDLDKDHDRYHDRDHYGDLGRRPWLQILSRIQHLDNIDTNC